MTRSESGALLRGSALVLFSALVTACAATGGSGGGGNPDLITREQIELLPDGTAFTVIQRFRSSWLRARTQGSFSSPEPVYAEVFVDQLHFGPIDALGNISSTEIQSIEYLNATDATTLYGTGYAGGVIRINTRGR